MDKPKAESIADALKAIVRLMVDRPDEVMVETQIYEAGVMYLVKAAKEDCGKLIGQGGRTARSLRIILTAISMTQKCKINLEIAD
jgi:predicted RNA-binding protein YlqC (UPF0109 family)